MFDMFLFVFTKGRQNLIMTNIDRSAGNEQHCVSSYTKLDE
jgi:hypothetical protein